MLRTIFQSNFENATQAIKRRALSITSSISKNPYAEKTDSEIPTSASLPNRPLTLLKNGFLFSFSFPCKQQASDNPLAKRNIGRMKSPKCTEPQTLWRNNSGRSLLSLSVAVKKTIPRIASPRNASIGWYLTIFFTFLSYSRFFCFIHCSWFRSSVNWIVWSCSFKTFWCNCSICAPSAHTILKSSSIVTKCIE